MQVSYQLSQAARRQVFVETGIEPAERQVVEIDPTTLTPQERELLYDLPTDPTHAPYRQLHRSRLSKWSYSNAGYRTEPAMFDRILSPDEVVEAAAALRTEHAAVLAQVEAKKAERQRAEEERARRVAEEQVRRAEEHRRNFMAELERLEALSDDEFLAHVRWVEGAVSVFGYRTPEGMPEEAERRRRVEERATALFAAARERREVERKAWIEAHGSAFLKKATAAGYDCQRRYVDERAAQELPGFLVDFKDQANWKSRACPSEAALDLELELREQGRQVEVVWLTEPASGRRADDFIDYDTDGEFEACEAVVIRGYLGKYDAIKEMP